MNERSTRRWTIALTGVGSLMAALDTLVVASALGTIRVDLGASLEQLEWTVNSYNLAFAVLLVTGAVLGDRFGRRRIFAAGLVVFALASAACALAPDVGWLIVARAVQGAGAAMLMPLALALLSSAFPPERRGAAIGMFSAVTGIAVALGPLVGGAVVAGLDWEWIFWLNVPIGLIAAPLARARLRESFGSETSLDLRGLALITAGALGVVWSLVRLNAAGPGSTEVLATMIGGLLLLAAFAAWERRAPAPMVPPGLFRSRAFAAGNGAVFFTFAALFSCVFLFAQYLQVSLGFSALEAGIRLMPWTITFILVAPVAGALADRVGERPFMLGGLLLQAAGLAWLALIAEPGLAYTSLLLPLVVAGVGVSMAIPAGQSSVVADLPVGELGRAAGATSTMRELGGVFGIAVVVAVFASAGGFASPVDFSDGFAPAVGTAAALSLTGAAIASRLPRRSPGASEPPARPVLEPDGPEVGELAEVVS